MKFHGIRGQEVELKIVNYEFPSKSNDIWDNNWLNIYVKVSSEVGNWQTVDPSLTTWEMRELIDWFEALAQRSTVKLQQLSFTEPNLSFELLVGENNKLIMFRIKFDLESKPQNATNNKEYIVDCSVDNRELKRIANDLKSELEKFPER